MKRHKEEKALKQSFEEGQKTLEVGFSSEKSKPTPI